MTLPASGPISMSQIAAELGISATGLSLGDSRVRALAGKPTGALSFLDLYGKTSFPPVAYTIAFGYEASGTVLVCDSTPFGSLTPGFSYRGAGIGGFYQTSVDFQMRVAASFNFTKLVIGSASMSKSAATFSTDGTTSTYAWGSSGFIDTSYSMTLEG
jgi:hypothetical protein